VLAPGTVLPGSDDHFLAADPTAPGRRAAGAVAQRPGEGKKLAFDFVRGRLNDQRGDAAAPGTGIVDTRQLGIAERALHGAEGRFAGAGVELVIAHDDCAPAGRREGVHVVGEPRHHQAVVHALADLRDDAVPKSIG
jgi:hypothetical protein